MSRRAKIAVGGVAIGLILWIFTSFWIALAVIVGIPAVTYLALDSSQRRRLRGISRRELGR